MSSAFTWVSGLGAGVLLIATTACVPLERHQDVLGELNRAVKVNGDLSNKLKEAEQNLAAMGGGENLWKARYDALNEQNRNLLAENGALEEQVSKLQAHLANLPELTPQSGNFAASDFKDLPGFEVTSDGALILDSGVLFAPGKATLRPDARISLDALAGVILEKHAQRVIHIEGHTDVTPIKRSPHKDNWDLGFKRAHSVFGYLTQRGATEQNFRLHTSGYAEPPSGVDPNTKEGQKLCRRVVIRLGRQS